MIDLHTHTTWSDGELTTLELLEFAEKEKIEILSITDHDNIGAYSELEEIRDKFSGKIIVGVELSFNYNDVFMEMLGYGVNLDILKEEQYIKDNLVHTSLEKETKLLEYFKVVCDKLGIVYSKKLMVNLPMANDVIADDILLHSENKKILEELGIDGRTSFCRKHMHNKESPFYIDLVSDKPNIFEVTDMIHRAGGKCFLAHPLIYGVDNPAEFLNNVISLNIIDGIECFQRKHDKAQEEFLVGLCNRHGLMKSGGSDFHEISQGIGHVNQRKTVLEGDAVGSWIDEIELI